jgi:hypothetical protein
MTKGRWHFHIGANTHHYHTLSVFVEDDITHHKGSKLGFIG